MNMLKRDLGTGDLCDNIGLVGVSAKWSYVTASPSHNDQAIPILSPLLLCMLAIPIFPFLKFKEFLIYLSRSICSNKSMHTDKTGHIIFFSNKPHCTTTMGTRVEKGQKSWYRIIHIYSGHYLSE